MDIFTTLIFATVFLGTGYLVLAISKKNRELKIIAETNRQSLKVVKYNWFRATTIFFFFLITVIILFTILEFKTTEGYSVLIFWIYGPPLCLIYLVCCFVYLFYKNGK